MKKLLVFISCIATLQLFAQDRMTPAVKTFEARTGKAIVLKDNNANGIYADITDNSSSVMFEYKFTASQNDAMSDDEYTETLGFNIVPDKTGKFVLKGEELRKAQGYFYKGCFCMDRGYAPIIDGIITGVKLSKTTWYVSVNVQIKTKQGDSEQTITKKLKGKFTITAK
ncbi:MAG: hypothetical protein V4590_07270 [Bacteroidota bacterium]